METALALLDCKSADIYVSCFVDWAHSILFICFMNFNSYCRLELLL